MSEMIETGREAVKKTAEVGKAVVEKTGEVSKRAGGVVREKMLGSIKQFKDRNPRMGLEKLSKTPMDKVSVSGRERAQPPRAEKRAGSVTLEKGNDGVASPQKSPHVEGGGIAKNDLEQLLEKRNRIDPKGGGFTELSDIPDMHFNVQDPKLGSLDIYASLALTTKSVMSTKECQQALAAYQNNPTGESAQNLYNTIQEHGKRYPYDKAEKTCPHGVPSGEHCTQCASGGAKAA